MDVIITAMPTERMDKMQENDKRQQEVQESVQEYHEDENAIDLISMLDDAIRCFKKILAAIPYAGCDNDRCFYYSR